MSGVNQHYLPRQLLRGFATRTKRGEVVWVYKPNAPAVSESIKKVGAEANYYSGETDTGTASLDDQITNFEQTTARTLQSLRAALPGDPVDPDSASELVAHLSVRTAHLRDTLSIFVRDLAKQARMGVLDKAKTQRALGLGGSTPSAELSRALDRLMAELGPRLRLQSPGMTDDELRAQLSELASISFDLNYENTRDSLAASLDHMSVNADEAAARSQRQALSRAVAPSGWTEKLKKFEWTVLLRPKGVILPDCAGVGLLPSRRFEPLMFAGGGLATGALVPITYDRVLVGARRALSRLPNDLNLQLARASSRFFVARNHEAGLENLSRAIGKGVSRSTKNVAQKAVRRAGFR